MKDELKNEIVIYQTEDGKTQIDVKMEDETIWLTQDAMAKLFETTPQNITIHIKNIYNEDELDKISTCKDFLQVRKEGTRNVSRNLTFYNLDMVLSVGYRIKSKVATRFRKWATATLKEYLTKGYAINEIELKKQREKVSTLKTTIDLLSRTVNNQVETLNEAKNIINTLGQFVHGLNLLDNFDHKTLDTKGLTIKAAVVILEEEFLDVVNKMKSEYASDVFANPKDKSFSSSINQIYQTFDGVELYPTLEEKAAMLLYLITKNHSFSDGNKRIAASCFLYFLDRNNLLYKNGVPIIDNGTLFVLTVLIAESSPKEMETMKQIVISVLNQGGSCG